MKKQYDDEKELLEPELQKRIKINNDHDNDYDIFMKQFIEQLPKQVDKNLLTNFIKNNKKFFDTIKTVFNVFTIKNFVEDEVINVYANGDNFDILIGFNPLNFLPSDSVNKKTKEIINQTMRTIQHTMCERITNCLDMITPKSASFILKTTSYLIDKNEESHKINKLCSLLFTKLSSDFINGDQLPDIAINIISAESGKYTNLYNDASPNELSNKLATLVNDYLNNNANSTTVKEKLKQFLDGYNTIFETMEDLLEAEVPENMVIPTDISEESSYNSNNESIAPSVAERIENNSILRKFLEDIKDKYQNENDNDVQMLGMSDVNAPDNNDDSI